MGIRYKSLFYEILVIGRSKPYRCLIQSPAKVNAGCRIVVADLGAECFQVKSLPIALICSGMAQILISSICLEVS